MGNEKRLVKYMEVQRQVVRQSQPLLDRVKVDQISGNYMFDLLFINYIQNGSFGDCNCME